MLNRDDMIMVITRILSDLDGEKVRFVYRMLLAMTRE